MTRLALLTIALLYTLAAGAHTTVERATPEDGAVLDRSPAKIEIQFKHSVQMTSVIATGADKAERKLAFAPMTSTQVITIANPGLGVGRNELRWKALSRDGHVISGTLVYVVGAASASP
jgi:methionine-rich copper-binding protein CopC